MRLSLPLMPSKLKVQPASSLTMTTTMLPSGVRKDAQLVLLRITKPI